MRRLIALVLTLGGAVMCSACEAIDNFGHFRVGSGDSGTVTTVEGYPASCREVLLGDPGAGDGAYRLFIGKDPARPWTAYCRDMATQPKDYIDLVMTGSNQNFSQFTAGGGRAGVSVRTDYQRLRFDPLTLKIDTADKTYASSMGKLPANPGGGQPEATSMSYAAAADCLGNDSQAGTGGIDLRGTPFAVPMGIFKPFGYAATCTATYYAGNQVVALTGGGYCGFCASGFGGAGPANNVDLIQMQLEYP
jgi:hypothetical protein